MAYVGFEGNADQVLWQSPGASTTLISWRQYGNSEVPSVSAAGYVEHSVDSTSMVNPQTPGKTNSRSPAAANQYGAAGVVGNFTKLILATIQSFTHVSIIFGRLWSPIAGQSQEAFGTAGTGDLFTSWSESKQGTARRISRRATKRGFWPMLGNDINRHVKTGAGSFSCICPHFDNDILWVDPFAWRTQDIRPQIAPVTRSFGLIID